MTTALSRDALEDQIFPNKFCFPVRSIRLAWGGPLPPHVILGVLNPASEMVHVMG